MKGLHLLKEIFLSSLCMFVAVSCQGMDMDNGSDRTGNETQKDTVFLSNLKPSLGVNYNEQLQFIDHYDLERTKTVWVRGFLDFFQLFDQPGSLATDEKTANFIALKSHGYKTILNIKWNFKGREESLPVPGSQSLETYLDFLEKLLEKVWSSTDILVVGNEPFIETNLDERDQRLVDFYKKVAEKVLSVRKKHLEKFIPLFLGAYNNLYDPAWQTDAARNLLQYVKLNPGIAGVDLHIHHAEMSQMQTFLDFASDRIRIDQKILVTEFSLVKHWKQQLNLSIPLGFAQSYGLDPAMKNYQYIDFALKNPRPQSEWFDFLKNSQWFESRKHYLREAFTLMKANPKFLLATYAIRQSYPFNQDFTVTTDPWVLNGLFANRTVKPESNGHNSLNYSFIDDFLNYKQ